MTEKPTVQQLLKDEALLRQVVGEVLNPRNIDHVWPDGHVILLNDKCIRCNRQFSDLSEYDSCIPDPDTRELAVIAEALEQMILPTDLIAPIVAYKNIGLIDELAKKALAYECYIAMDPAQRIACCLVALDKARLEGGA